jgi:GT2 family glycosyltransferase
VPFEAFVVSDGPDAATDEIVRRYAPSIPVRGLTQVHGGPARARNSGAGEAAGEFLLFLDDDCLVATDWLRQWEIHANRDPDSAAGGGTRNSLTGNLCACASQLLLDFIHEYFNEGIPGRQPFVASNNLCVPAEQFRMVGGFSARFPLAAAEDRDFCDRWHARGWPLRRMPQALVFHAHRMNVAGFWRQHWNYGRGAYRLRQERKGREQSSRIEPFQFYADLLRFPFSHERFGRALPLCFLLCVSQVANGAGFLRECLGGMRRYW